MAEEAAIALDVTDVPESSAGPADTKEAEQAAPEESSTKEKEAATETDAKAEEPAKADETEGKDDADAGEDTADEAEEAGDDESETDETDTDQPKKGAEQRKEQLNSEIRELVSQRNSIRDDVARANANAYRPASADELQEQGMDEATAKVTALEQRTQMAEFNARVADVTASVNTEALQVMHDFPVFDPQSPSYNEELATLATNTYRSVAGVKVDEKTGLMYDVAAMPYNVYQTIAKAFESGASTGQVKGQKATEKMLAASDTQTSSAPKRAAKEDPFLTGLTRNLDLPSA